MDNTNLLCMGCFAQRNTGRGICPYCGYDENKLNVAPYQLPPRTIIGGKYMIGKVLGEGGFGITYIAYDLNLEIVIAVKEYYPSGLATRSNTDSITVQTFGNDNEEYFNYRQQLNSRRNFNPLNSESLITPNSATNKELEERAGWRRGQRLFHESHGYGAVMEVKDSDEGPIVHVIFDNGQKKLFLSEIQGRAYEKVED